MDCAGGSPISGVDRMTCADVAGGVGTGVGEASPLHPQSNIADNTQIPESRHRSLRTVAFLVVVFKGGPPSKKGSTRSPRELNVKFGLK